MRILPHNLELEQSILGYLLYNGSEAVDIFIDLEIEYFYDNNIQFIIKNLYEMMICGEFIDLITVDNKLKDTDIYKSLGGRTYLIEIIDNMGNTLSIKTAIKQLLNLYKQREIIKQARYLETVGYGEDIDNGVIKCFQNINAVLNEGANLITDMNKNIEMLKQHIKESKNKALLGYSWGLDWLNYHTGGIRKGKTYRIGGTSGAGKTSLIYQIINTLLEQGAKVLFISLENTIQTSLINFLSTKQGVNPLLIEKGKIEANFDYLEKHKNNFMILDSINDLSSIKREVLKIKPDVVILDYIGLVEIKGYDELTKYNKYADDVRHFIQQNQNLAWIDLSNLNKGESEDSIRMFGGFNGSAKLRNNTDFAMHIFSYKPFNDYKQMALQVGTNEVKEKLLGKKVNTFLITKSRFGDDGIDKQYIINFNNGIKFIPATQQQLDLWNTL